MTLNTPDQILKAIKNPGADLRLVDGKWWLHESDTFTRRRRAVCQVPGAAVANLLAEGKATLQEVGGVHMVRKGKLTNKHHAQKAEVDGIVFDSRMESTRYGILRMMERAGQITDLEAHPRFVLEDGFDTPEGRQRAIHYTPDFTYSIPGEERMVAEDVKGYAGVITDAFRLRAKLFRLRYPQYELRVVDYEGKPLKSGKAAKAAKTAKGKRMATDAPGACASVTIEEYRRMLEDKA